jgi:hypothetical protein
MANAQTWKKRVEEWRTSGLRADEFCRRRRLGIAGLYRWSSILKRAGGSARTGTVRAIPMARLVPRPASPSAGASEVLVSIEVAGARVTVAAGVDRETLASVLDVLEARRKGAGR